MMCRVPVILKQVQDDGNPSRFVIASAAKQSSASLAALDCRVAPLLAMTGLCSLRTTGNESPSFSKEGLGWFLSSEKGPFDFKVTSVGAFVVRWRERCWRIATTP